MRVSPTNLCVLMVFVHAGRQAGMEQLPEWRQFFTFQSGVETMQPEFYCKPSREQAATWWMGLLIHLAPLLRECKPPLTIAQFSGLTRLGSVDLPVGFVLEGDPLHTGCVLAVSLVQWIKKSANCVFKLRKNPKDLPAHTPNYAYIKVKVKGFEDNDFEFYLHRLLCYMYRGPPANKGMVAGHMCNHMACIAPWHLTWQTNAENVQQGYDHRQQLDYSMW
jgi:hypothetical protein